MVVVLCTAFTSECRSTNQVNVGVVLSQPDGQVSTVWGRRPNLEMLSSCHPCISVTGPQRVIFNSVYPRRSYFRAILISPTFVIRSFAL
jgi:hypothetical protein